MIEADPVITVLQRQDAHHVELARSGALHRRIAEILHEFFPKSELARVWLNTPHPDLDRQTALELILANKPDAVLRLLENAVAGVPV